MSGARGFKWGVLTQTPYPLPAEVPKKLPVGPTSSAPSPDDVSSSLLFTLSPWKCTDDTMEIVIARSNLEVRAVPEEGMASCSRC